MTGQEPHDSPADRQADHQTDRRVVLGTYPTTLGKEPSATRQSEADRQTEEPSTTRRSEAEEVSGRGRYWRKRLPHFDVPGLIQHITFHLADSLPRSAIERMQQELAAIPEPNREAARRQRIQELLDSGLGTCVLGEPACAQIVQDSLLFGDGDRYHLFAWVVMPNHVHVLIEQIPGWPMSKVVQSWKRHTSRQIHRLGGSSSARPDADSNLALPVTAMPPLWQQDYWDRFMRNDRHFEIAKHYIETNPVVAELAATPEAWPWGSAAHSLAGSRAQNLPRGEAE